MSLNNQTSFGPYKLIEELGRGKRTVVYKALQTNLDREVALKVLRRGDPETLKRFRAEARMSARLNNPGIRRIHEAGQTPQGYIYVAMEFVTWSLKKVISERFAQDRTFTREEVGQLLTPIAQALDEIHKQGLAHLDIKPDNILVSESGRAMLADFGISRKVGETTHEGTPLYLSPEQAAGNQPVGPWSDVYSLAVLIYEMVTGRPPFVADLDMVLLRQHLEEDALPPRKLNPALDRDLERTLMAALSKDPRQRPPSATALLQAVRERQKVTPATQVVERATDVVRSTTTAVRERPQLALFLIVPVLLVIGVFIVINQFDATSETPTPSVTAIMPSVDPTETSPAELTETPTVTLEPTRAPPTSTPLPATATLIPNPSVDTAVPTTNGGVPLLVYPSGIQLTEKDKKVTFTWEGELDPGQQFVFELCHFDEASKLCETVESAALTTNSYTYDLPKPGEWHWWIRVEPGNAQSDTAKFWLSLYGP